jgi:Lrp/AsnC family transcriptional regulator for asnA, asnC and gidA
MVGFSRQAMIGIKTRGDVTRIAEAICEIPQVDYVVTTAGGYDLLVELVCEDDAELLDVLMTRIRSLDGITETETFVYLKLNKQHYDWGTR